KASGIRGPSPVPDEIRLHDERPAQCTGARVMGDEPALRLRLVRFPGEDEHLAVGAEADLRSIALESKGRTDRLPGGGVPEPRRPQANPLPALAAGDGGQAAPGGVELDVPDLVVVAQHRRRRRAGAAVPDLYGMIETGRGDEVAVGAEGDTGDGAVVEPDVV